MSASAAETFDSARQRSPLIEELRQLIRYRSLVKQLVLRGVRARYKRSVLGIFWTMLNPLLMMIVLTIVYQRIFQSHIPHYATYTLAGLICWHFFSQTTGNAVSELVWGGTILTRIYVPRAVFAATALGVGLVNFALALVTLVAVMLVTGTPIRPAILFTPVAVLLLAMFTVGVGLLLSSLAVYFADVHDMFQAALLLWMCLTPINYSRQTMPEKYQWILGLNPMTYLIDVFRLPVQSGVLPGRHTVLTAAVISTATLLIGWVHFTRKAEEYAYRV